VHRIKQNWNLDPLLAVPDVDGLRPADIDAVAIDFVRYLGHISQQEKDVKVAQASMIDERNRRLEGTDIIEGKDKLLKLSDLNNILERYRKVWSTLLRIETVRFNKVTTLRTVKAKQAVLSSLVAKAKRAVYQS